MQPQSLLRHSRRYYWLSAYPNRTQVAARRSATFSALSSAATSVCATSCCPCCCSCI